MPIHSHALEIVQTLNRAGHIAYFAGGWVRDYLMGHPSDDIDIATSASPEQVLDLFPRTILVGLQFGVVIVPIDGHQYEVSSFRKDFDYIDGRKPGRIELTSPEEDAKRRDFTINGMFYDPIEDKIMDYVGGVEDIKKGVVRAIGNPDERFYEDRLRMIRACRFAARFDFHIDLETQEAIKNNALGLFPSVAMERVWQEFCKMSAYPRFERALVELHRFGLLQILFPQLHVKKLKELEELVQPIAHYPKGTPTLFFLSELFQDLSKEEIVDLSKSLKAPNKEIDLLSFYLEAYPFSLEKSPSTLSRFYAYPQSGLCLEIFAARLEPQAKEKFLSAHEKMKSKLSKHIERLHNKTPVLTSQFLKAKGIPPGIKMGNLLKRAEELSINENIDDPELLFKRVREEV
jgi:poly(A) polymerase